jgi:hypothetical protein
MGSSLIASTSTTMKPTATPARTWGRWTRVSSRPGPAPSDCADAVTAGTTCAKLASMAWNAGAVNRSTYATSTPSTDPVTSRPEPGSRPRRSNSSRSDANTASTPMPSTAPGTA